MPPQDDRPRVLALTGRNGKRATQRRGWIGARTNGIQPLDRISEKHIKIGAEALSSVISVSLTKLFLADLVFGAHQS